MITWVLLKWEGGGGSKQTLHPLHAPRLEVAILMVDSHFYGGEVPSLLDLTIQTVRVMSLDHFKGKVWAFLAQAFLPSEQSGTTGQMWPFGVAGGHSEASPYDL